MEINFIKKTGVLLSLLATATFAHASIITDKVPCPSLSTIQETASKIDAVQENDGTFIAYTSTAAFNQSNLPWYVGVITSLDSAQQAIKQGQETVRNINLKANEEAFEDGTGHFVCLYKPGTVVALGGNMEQPTLFKRR